MKTTRVLVGLCTAALGVCGVSGCSTQEFLQGGSVIKGSPQTRDSSQQTMSKSETIVSELEGERESPPVEVAGSNLVGDCYFLSDSPSEVTEGSVECSLGADKVPQMIVAASAQLSMGLPDQPPVVGSISGLPGPMENSYLVSDSSPLNVRFTVSKNDISAMIADEVSVTFEKFHFAGKSSIQKLAVKMKAHKKKVDPNATCVGSEMTKSVGVSVDLLRAGFSAVGSFWNYMLTDAMRISGCDFALEFTGGDLKAGAVGYVAIVDSSTLRRSIIFKTNPPPLVPFLAGVGEKSAQCPSRRAGDTGKWLCSDYLNIFADDLKSGLKYIEVFGLADGFSPLLHIKKP